MYKISKAENDIISLIREVLKCIQLRNDDEFLKIYWFVYEEDSTTCTRLVSTTTENDNGLVDENGEEIKLFNFNLDIDQVSVDKDSEKNLWDVKIGCMSHKFVKNRLSLRLDAIKLAACECGFSLVAWDNEYLYFELALEEDEINCNADKLEEEPDLPLAQILRSLAKPHLAEEPTGRPIRVNKQKNDKTHKMDSFD